MDKCNSQNKQSSPLQQSICNNPEQLLLAACAIAIAITQGRSNTELETLLNLLSLIRENTQRILAQRLICERDTINLEVEV